jgi:hypothetical protein
MIAVALALGMLAAVPASALGAQRFASPAGTGTTCSQPAPCSLVTAVNSASGADEVIVAGDQGTYGTPSSPVVTQLHDVAGGVNVHGVAGQPMPVIYSNVPATNALQLNSGGTASYLHIENLASNGTALFVGNSVDHVYASGGSEGCLESSTTSITDAVCVGGTIGFDSNTSSSGTQTTHLRNVTAVGGTWGIFLSASNFTYDVFATNVIARGGLADIHTSQSSGFVTFTLDHSNYANIDPGVGTSITPVGGSNQAAAPMFANAAAGDFHQVAGSPTINAGADDPLNGVTDLEGKPRQFGAHTDIGADEYAPPAVLGESVASIATTSAVFGGVVNTQGVGGLAWIEYGTTMAYGSSVSAGALAFSGSPQSLSAAVGGLQPGTNYHYRVAAANGSGTTYGQDQSFTTVAMPGAGPTGGPTGQRAAALKKCKKKHSKRARRRCKRKAWKLPV